MCPLTKFEGGLNLLHEADDDAVIWLEATELQHSRNELGMVDLYPAIHSFT